MLQHPFFSVEQHTDSSQNSENLISDVKEAEPAVTQQPVTHKKNFYSVELCSAAPKTMTPHEDTVSTWPENVSAQLEDEEDEAAHVQPSESHV